MNWFTRLFLSPARPDKPEWALTQLDRDAQLTERQAAAKMALSQHAYWYVDWTACGSDAAWKQRRDELEREYNEAFGIVHNPHTTTA